MPFSDPMADGPVLQRAAGRALAAGTTLPRVLELVGELRRDVDVPIVLFGYYNPFFRYGVERARARRRRGRRRRRSCASTCRPRRPATCAPRRAAPGST